MNKTNLLIDLGIFTAFLVAMEPRFTGEPLHEWLSLALAAAAVVHIVKHWSWIVTIGRRFFIKLWGTSRLKFVVDILLFLSFVMVMLSGMLISRTVVGFFGFQLEENFTWRILHSLSANASLSFVALHFALNARWLAAMLNRYLIAPLTAPFKRQPQAAVVPVEVRKD